MLELIVDPVSRKIVDLWGGIDNVRKEKCREYVRIKYPGIYIFTFTIYSNAFLIWLKIFWKM